MFAISNVNSNNIRQVTGCKTTQRRVTQWKDFVVDSLFYWDQVQGVKKRKNWWVSWDGLGCGCMSSHLVVNAYHRFYISEEKSYCCSDTHFSPFLQHLIASETNLLALGPYRWRARAQRQGMDKSMKAVCRLPAAAVLSFSKRTTVAAVKRSNVPILMDPRGTWWDAALGVWNQLWV